jgi:hypothetical protein
MIIEKAILKIDRENVYTHDAEKSITLLSMLIYLF